MLARLCLGPLSMCSCGFASLVAVLALPAPGGARVFEGPAQNVNLLVRILPLQDSLSACAVASIEVAGAVTRRCCLR